MYFYDAATDRCLINFTRVFKKVVTNYENLGKFVKMKYNDSFNFNFQ